MIRNYCSACGTYEVRDGKYCSVCGKRLTFPPAAIGCPECGEETRYTDRYCINCGAVLRAKGGGKDVSQGSGEEKEAR